jgi:GNAT superfamily N-acetyltransferase
MPKTNDNNKAIELPLPSKLDKSHDRSQFSCGVEALDRYLKERASQEAARKIAAPFVVVDSENAVIGYYTLSVTGIDVGDWPEDIAQRLPKYPVTPATLLGRLAVDKRHRGQGLGEHLLLDALFRSWSLADHIGSAAVVVDAKDDSAQSFYLRYGFLSFPERPARLFIPMSSIAELADRVGLTRERLRELLARSEE